MQHAIILALALVSARASKLPDIFGGEADTKLEEVFGEAIESKGKNDAESAQLQLDLKNLEDSMGYSSPALRRAALVRTVPASLLPGHHPFVEKALTGMKAEVQALEEKQAAVNQAQGKLRGAVTGVAKQMNSVATIKHIIVQQQALLRNQEHQMKVLQGTVTQLEETHAKLMKSVHKTMDSKVESAARRLQNKQEQLRNEEDATKYWRDQELKVKMETNEAMEDEKVAHTRLVELKGQLEIAQQQETIAENKAQYEGQMAHEEVQSLQYAKAKFNSEMFGLRAAGETVKAVAQTLRSSSDGNDSIRAMERVEDADEAVRVDANEAQNWKDNVESINAQAVEMLKENQTSHDSLLEMQARVTWLKHDQLLADKQYKLKAAMAIQEVSNLKYIVTKFKAEASKSEAAKASVASAKKSVQALEAIRASEVTKVGDHLAIGKRKLQANIEQWQAVRGRTISEIATLRQRYASWHDQQQHLGHEVARSQSESIAASQEYADRQREAFSKAQAKAYEAWLPPGEDAWDGEWPQ